MTAYIEMAIQRLNRLARAASVGATDADWLETERSKHGVSPWTSYPQLISALQSVYALKAVEERLKS